MVNGVCLEAEIIMEACELRKIKTALTTFALIALRSGPVPTNQTRPYLTATATCPPSGCQYFVRTPLVLAFLFLFLFLNKNLETRISFSIIYFVII